MKINYDNKIIEKDKPLMVIDLLSEEEKENKDIIICKVDHRVRELSYMIDKDCKVEFLKLDYDESVRIYEASIRFLFAMALNNIYPELKVNFSYYVSRSVFATLEGKKFSNFMVNKIEKEMERIVEEDYIISRKKVSIEKAKLLYKKNNLEDKIKVLKYRPEDFVNIYDCNNYQNYFYSYMVYSTGYLDKFKIKKYKKGVIIQFPRSEKKGDIPKFKNEKVYASSLNEAKRWAKKMRLQNIADVNLYLEEGIPEFIGLCEARHDQQLQKLANKISKNKKIKLIAIAGPSSSGKTTFSNKLRIQLLTRGIKPVKLSIDDYYIDRDKIKKDKNGKMDLEHINTIDVELFNKHLAMLIEGKEVDIPKFDFKIQRRVKGKKMKVTKKSVIIIEGIHALNNNLTKSIKEKNKFKVYIAPHLQMNLDNHNPISITYYRLVRRLVRDNLFRSASASETLSMWESVRKGEFRWIYDNQENADFVFNSFLTYEMCVLKKYAIPLLKEIKKEDENYILASKVIKFLKYFKTIDKKYIPCDSLLCEFIGGSCFK